MAKKNKWISSAKFKNLKPGDNVVIRYMIGDAQILGEPVIDLKNIEEIKRETIDVRFNSGPWKGKTLKLIRQQISTGSKSFPDRTKDYYK